MLRLHRKVWIQLAVLAAVTLLACGIMALSFMKLPETLFGIGQYTVTVQIPASGGLYPTSLVTYRGTEIGRVQSVDVTPAGVRAVLALDSDTPVPSAVDASVHSRSAIGEQYVELTLKPGAGEFSPPLREGDVIDIGDVRLPADIGPLLDAANRALKAIPPDNLRTVVEESDTAIGGLGPDLSRIVDGSTSLAIDAGKTIDPLTRLIDQSLPVLDSQVRTSDSIAAWAQRMAVLTGQMKAQDAAFRDLLVQSGPGLDEGRQLFDRVAPALPVLLANLTSLGQIAISYRADLEQLLVLVPQGTAAMSAIIAVNAGTPQDLRGAFLDFNLNINSAATVHHRIPARRSTALPLRRRRPERPAADLYCRIPQDSDHNVRGIRNIPCETVPGKRAPTVEMCESDEQYVPSTTAWPGKATRTPPHPVRACRSIRRRPLSPARRRHRWRSPPTTRRRELCRPGRPTVHPSRPGRRATDDVAIDAGPARFLTLRGAVLNV